MLCKKKWNLLQNIVDVKICAKYIFVPYTFQKTKYFKAESHSIIHKITDAPSTLSCILVLFLTNSTFFFYFRSWHYRCSQINKLTWQHLMDSHPFLQRITYENVLRANFYIEEVFVANSIYRWLHHKNKGWFQRNNPCPQKIKERKITPSCQVTWTAASNG